MGEKLNIMAISHTVSLSPHLKSLLCSDWPSVLHVEVNMLDK